MKPLEVCAIDVETTGLDREKDRIVSIGLARTTIDVNGDKMLDCETLNLRVNPGIPVPSEASAIHGIYNHHVENEAPFEEYAKQVREVIGDRILIGHNVDFDKKFLSAAFKRAGLKTLHRNTSICTMQEMKRLRGNFGAGYVNTSLAETAFILGLQGRKDENHEALEDALLSLRIAGWFLTYEAGTSGVRDETLQEIFDVMKTKEGREYIKQELKGKRASESSGCMLWFFVPLGVCYFFMSFI